MDGNAGSTKIKEWIFVLAALFAVLGAVLSILKFVVHLGESSKPNAAATGTYQIPSSASLTNTSFPTPDTFVPPPSETAVTSTTSPPPPPSTANPPQYVSVDLTDLCNSASATLTDYTAATYGCRARDTVIGSTDFPWDLATPANIPAGTSISFSSTSCREITLRFAFQPDGYEPGLTAKMSIVQDGPPPQSVTITRNIGVLHAKLYGGPWALTGLTNQNRPDPWAVFTSGTAQCTTDDGS
jgi:hypothetical protein